MVSNRVKNQQGFALPIAMGMGVVLLLIGVSTVVRSQVDSTVATTQKSTARGLSAAETGIGLIQEKINNARAIAKYPACISWSTGDSCSDTTASAASWKNPTTIPNLTTGCTGSLTATDISSIADRAWKNVDSSDATKGQYRFVDYTYAAGVGTLTVEGRVNQSNASNTSTSRLQVKIPVVDASSSSSVPALWIGNGSGTDMNNDKIKGNIVVNTCTLSSLANPPTTANLSDSTAYSVKAIPRNLPGTPSLPATYNNLTTGTLNPWQTLPRAGDVTYTDSKGNIRYAYLVKDLNKSGNVEITLANSTVKVDLFVQGNISLSGNPDINPSGSSTQMRIFGNESTGASSYKYGCASGVSCPTSQVHFNGTGTINAFIYAPAGTGSVNGGGNTNGNIKGSLWIKDWDASSGNNKVKVDSVGNYGDFGWDNPQDRATLAPITAWDRQQVN
jgi:Tfp pilus assembly protein PilX